MKTGDIVKMPDGSVWFCSRANDLSAYMLPVWSGKRKPITTRKRVTKMVMDMPQPMHISSDAVVDLIDPNSAYAVRIRERFMGNEEQRQPSEAQVKEQAQEPIRQTQIYVRTEKQPKNQMRGQGAIVLAALDEMGQGTIAQVTAKCKGKFQTRQEETRVVGFYLSKFKREGLVTAAQPEAGQGQEAEQAVEA